MSAVDVIARALFDYEAQPDPPEVTDRAWARIVEKHGTNSEWHREAQAVTEALGLDRPDTCCGKCPPIVGGGYDCTCVGNPRCAKGDDRG